MLDFLLPPLCSLVDTYANATNGFYSNFALVHLKCIKKIKIYKLKATLRKSSTK